MPANKIRSNRHTTEKQHKNHVDTVSNEEKDDFGYYDLSILPPTKRRSVSSPFNLPYRGFNKTIIRCVLGISLIYLALQIISRYGLTKKNLKSTGNAILVWNNDDKVEWDRLQCGCLVTKNRNYDKKPIDAVVVYGDRPYSLLDLEKTKHTANYLLVFTVTHPLSLSQNPFHAVSGAFFNYTMTYRLDSDLIRTEYYFSTLNRAEVRLEEFDLPQEDNFDVMSTDLIQKIRQKQYLATYMMYHVNDYSLPESLYLQELRKYIMLGAHDSCFGNDCCRYKFMLIFEPSSCPDYVHPQFYMALHNFVVPVLIGGTNLTKLAPPNSYISSFDFESPKLLAEHLKMLALEPELYERFFWWRSKYQLQKVWQPYCKLCRQLRRKREPRQPHMFLNWWTKYKCSNRSDRRGWSTKYW